MSKDGMCNANKEVDSCAYYYLLGPYGTLENLFLSLVSGIARRDRVKG
jgi:hypothetical protein